MKALDARQELATPMVAIVAVLAVAGVAWAAMVPQSHSMAGTAGNGHGRRPDRVLRGDVGRDDGGDDVALAIRVILEFARTAERRRGWPVATGVLAVTYLAVWLMFGVVR
jgi:hypothetical protein